MTRSWSKLILVLLVVAGLGLAVGSNLSTAQGHTYKFYIVSHGGPADPFWGVVMKGMEDAAATLSKGTGDTIQATYSGPEKFSIQKLVDLLNAAIAAQPDGLAVTITDPAALDEPLRDAIEKKHIPVIAINVADPRPANERIPYLFYIGMDEYLGGKQAAERMLRVRTPKRAVCAIHEVGHVGLEARCRGFDEVMSQAGVPVEKLDIGTDPTKAYSIIESYFAKHPETDAILTLGPLGTKPAVDFLKDKGLAGEVMHGTFDLDDVTLHAIEDGTTMFAVTQQQYLQGYLPILFLYLYDKYAFLPATDVLTGPGFVDKNNVKKVEELIKQGYW